jgi:hypothetical protein
MSWVVLLVSLVSGLLLDPCSTARADNKDEVQQAPQQPRQAPTAPAQTQGRGRTMGGHEFPFALFVPSSFVVSTFGVHAGGEWRRTPRFPTDTSTGSDTQKLIDLSTASATESFDGQIRLLPVLALTFDFYGKTRVGTNTPTLLGTGADFEVGGNAGLMVRLLRSKYVQLSLRASGGYYGGQQAGIARFYQSVRAIGEQTAARALAGRITSIEAERRRIDAALIQAARGLLTSISGFRTAGTLTAAAALGSLVGVQTMAGYMFEQSSYTSNQFELTSDGTTRLNETSKLSQFMVGLALDLSGASRGVPLDLVGEYVLLPISSKRKAEAGSTTQQSALEHRVALGLYYAGRTDLQLGLSAYGLLAQVPELGADARASGKPRDVGGLFSFRYIW